MALVPLLHGLPIAVHNAVLVQLLLRRLFVQHLSGSLPLLLHIGVYIHQLQGLLLARVVLTYEAVVATGGRVLVYNYFAVAFARDHFALLTGVLDLLVLGRGDDAHEVGLG